MNATTWDVISTVCLMLVALACLLHINAHVGRESAHCERFGFVLTGAGAFGVAVYLWWPKIEPFHFDVLMHAGMALIAISLVRGQLRAWLVKHGMTGADRRRHTDGERFDGTLGGGA